MFVRNLDYFDASDSIAFFRKVSEYDVCMSQPLHTFLEFSTAAIIFIKWFSNSEATRAALFLPFKAELSACCVSAICVYSGLVMVYLLRSWFDLDESKKRSINSAS